MEAGERAPSSPAEGGARHLPQWFTQFDGLAWAVDAEGSIVFASRALSDALGASDSELIGRSCARVFRLHDQHGSSYCDLKCIRDDPTRVCALPAALNSKSPLGELRLCLIQHQADSAPPVYLHLAEHKGEDPVLDYVEALAQRSATHARESGRLTPTELKVLEALCRDETAPEIAEELDCAIVTVRNHIQHILRKMGAHSIPEAVARHLLQRG